MICKRAFPPARRHCETPGMTFSSPEYRPLTVGSEFTRLVISGKGVRLVSRDTSRDTSREDSRDEFERADDVSVPSPFAHETRMHAAVIAAAARTAVFLNINNSLNLKFGLSMFIVPIIT